MDEAWLKDVIDYYPDSKLLSEGGYNYIYFQNLPLPEGCEPSVVEALLCVQSRDGYDSRLFVSKQIIGCPAGRNWNANICLFDKNWFAISWRSAPGLSYIEMLMVHLSAFKNG